LRAVETGNLDMSEQRIILADDDPIMRELAAAKLCDAGYQVQVVENGAQALELLKRDGADLVISDIDMPVMNGFDLTRNIRADGAIDQTPVIVITGSDHGGAVEKAFAAGATSFLAKPINWTLFTQAVMFVLRASKDQKALRTARDQAEAGEKFKNELMSVMSHELRTPLNAIIGFGQLLGEQFEDNKDHLHREYADYIVEGGRRLLNSVSDMLLASDARSGPITINETDTTVGDLITAAIAMTPRTVGADKAEANIVLKVKHSDLEICCDLQLTARAINKLIDNAIKFSPRGGQIIVATTLTEAGALAIMVKDSGPGIAAEKLAEIAAPFAQSDMSGRRTKEGLGLGVPLVHAITKAHGAKFRLSSKVGEGVRALIILPASRVRLGPGATVGSIAR
jgi:two-component system, sensor histidine kinase and response regulator